MAIALKESIVIGFTDFWSRKVRGLITVFGILLGTMSIIVVLSLVNGVNKQSLAWMMERGGLAKITVHRNWTYEKDTDERRYFLLKEIRLIQSLLPEVQYFNPQIRRYFKLSHGSNDYRSSVYGIVPDFENIEEWSVEEGRFISDFDINNSNDVICIGTKIKEELFGNREALGQFITVQQRRLQIIGIMKHRFLKNNNNIGNENSFAYLNRRAYIPLTTMIHKIHNKDEIYSFQIKASSPEAAPELKNKLESILLNLRHGEPVFEIESAQESAEEIKENSKIFYFIFFMISAISLLVGGIVISNIMLATVQERTREIGIRIAVGARRRDIFIQFLVQTILITTIGGIIGIITGLSILNLVEKFLKFELVAAPAIVLVALLVSAGVGFLAGIIPAIMASKLNPVEALRYE